MPLVDIANDQIPSTYGPLNAKPQPNLLTMTFQATCRLLLVSRRILGVVSVSSRLFLPYKGSDVTRVQ